MMTVEMMMTITMIITRVSHFQEGKIMCSSVHTSLYHSRVCRVHWGPEQGIQHCFTDITNRQ